MKRKRGEEFPPCPLINADSLKFDADIIVQIRRAIGCTYALFRDLQSPPKLIEGPNHICDDVGEIVEVKYSNPSPVPIDLDQWCELREKFVNKLNAITNVTMTHHYASGNHHIVFTIGVEKKRPSS